MPDYKNISDKVADAPSASWVYHLLPSSLWPLAQLARWDRPIGWQLLLWPCLWATTMATIQIRTGDIPLSLILSQFIHYCLLFLLGAIVMRGAGCTYNDLIDHELDARVERTRSRPLPAKRISRGKAKLFVIAQLVLGAIVLFQFNGFTIILAILSLGLVVIYPFAKRFTDWPQLFLGLVFSWGALVGWSAVLKEVSWASFSLYIATVFWTIGYDTIYAHQDKDDDALIGVRSTARLFAHNTRIWLIIFYGLALIFFVVAFYLSAMGFIVYVSLFLVLFMFIWQIRVMDIDDPDQCLRLFKFNSRIGLVIFLGLVVELFML